MAAGGETFCPPELYFRVPPPARADQPSLEVDLMSDLSIVAL